MKTIYQPEWDELSYIDANDQNALFIKAFIDHEEGETQVFQLKFNYFTADKALISFKVFKKDLEDLLERIKKMEKDYKKASEQEE